MVQLPKVDYFVKQNILKQKSVPKKVYEMPHKLCKGHVKTTLVCPYERVEHVPNFKPHGRRWRPCSRIFRFGKIWVKEKEIEPFDLISENS